MNNEDKLRKIIADPILWIETFAPVVTKTGEVIPFKMNPQQKYLMRNKDKFNIVLKSRQLGISTLVNAYSLYLAINKPNTTCLLMSHSDKSATDIFSKLKATYDYLPECVRMKTIANNRKELAFINHSRIIVCTCGAKDNARGATISLVHLSEVGLMKDHLEHQMAAIEQALTPDGIMILESTAHGLNKFSEMWNKAVSKESPLWKPFFFSWVKDKRMFAEEYKEYAERYINLYGNLREDELDNAEIILLDRGATMEQLMWRRLKILNSSEETFAQEFPSTPTEAFISTGSNVFSAKLIHERLSGLSSMEQKKLPSTADSILRKYKQYLTIWKLPTKGKRYYIGVDTGEGLGSDNDYSVIEVLDADGFQCAEWRSNKVKPYAFTEIVYRMGLFYNCGLLVIEKASAGHTVVDKVKHDFHYINMFKYKSYDQKTGKGKRKVGWETTAKSKPMMVNDMQEMFETGQCLVNSKPLLEEMKLFELVDGSFKAASGHDDTVMAYAMALQGIKSGQYYFHIGK